MLAVVLLASTVRGLCVPPPACRWSRRSPPIGSGPPTTPSGPATGSTRPREPVGERVDTGLAIDEVRGDHRPPVSQHEVIVARDVGGRSPAEVRDALDLTASEERDLLNQARGRVRSQVDERLRGGGT